MQTMIVVLNDASSVKEIDQETAVEALTGIPLPLPPTESGRSRVRVPLDFRGSSHTSDLKMGTPMATLPGAWRYRVSVGTGRPGVSTL